MNKTFKINVVEHRVGVSDLPPALDGLRIAHFGDLHAPKPIEFIRQVNTALRAVNADILMTTGDILDHAHWASAARRQLPVLMAGLRPRLGFYASLGNHDRQSIVPILEDLGAQVLLNRWVRVGEGDAAIQIGGIYASRLHRWPLACRYMLSRIPAQGPRIVLSHLPSAIWAFSGPSVDLMLSGHTHGGQWRFPRIGCVWAHDNIPLRLAYGLSRIGPTHLYVTSGLGESGPVPVRFRCPPEIAVLCLSRNCAQGC